MRDWCPMNSCNSRQFCSTHYLQILKLDAREANCTQHISQRTARQNMRFPVWSFKYCCERMLLPVHALTREYTYSIYQWATKRCMQQNVVGPVSKSMSISPSISALTRRYLTTLHIKQHKDFQGSRIQPQHSRLQILQPMESNLHTCYRSASDAVQSRIGATIDHFWT